MSVSTYRGLIARRTFLAVLPFFLICVASVPTPAQNNAANSLINFATKVVAPDSDPFPLLSIPISVNDSTTRFQIRQQNLRSISFLLEDLGGLDLDDFLPLTKDEKSGLALYAESGDVPEFFNFAEGDPTSDIPLILKSAPTVVDLATGYLITFEPRSIGGSTQIQINDDVYPDFYIVARTSIELRHGDSFEARMNPGMITVEDRDPSVGMFHRFDLPFPSPEFAESLSTRHNNLAVLPEYSKRAIFQGDIVQLYNTTTIGQRITNRSEPTTVIAMDLVGAASENYFVKEVRVNFIGVDLYPISWLWGQPRLPGGGLATANTGFGGYVNGPTYLMNNPYDPLVSSYVQVPKFLQNPQLYQTFPPPLAVPNAFGTTVFDRNNPNRAHYLADRGTDVPKVISPEVLLDLLKDGAGGVFLFTDGPGGTKGVYEPTVDRRLVLGDDVRFEDLDVTTIPHEVIDRLLPTELLRSNRCILPRDPYTGEVRLSFLLDDGPLDWMLLPGLAGLLTSYAEYEPPSTFKIDSSVVDNYKVAPRDFTWDTGRYLLGLSRPLVEALLADAAAEAADMDGDGVFDGDGIDNSTELFGQQLISGFTMVLPLSSKNPSNLLRVPSTDSVQDNTDDPELYIAIKTSDKLRNLNTILPFILPGDVTIGKRVDDFVGGATDVETLPSLARVGLPRTGLERLLPERPGEARTATHPLVGRPRPQFTFQDLTQPGPGDNSANNNMLGGPALGSPPKAVIGISAVDFGQNCNLMFNNTTGDDGEAVFFTECTVFDNLAVDFLPAPGESEFNTDIINGVTTTQGIDSTLNRIISTHQVILYVDDDTERGDEQDNDGDGMVDEELRNLIDDDGDGLIDEDCGDGDPAGINGVFDQYDDFILPMDDHIGPVRRVVGGPNTVDSAYRWAVNHGEFIPDPLDPAAEGTEITDDAEFAPLIPIGAGAYQAKFDLRLLKIGSLPWSMRDPIFDRRFPIREPDGPFELTAEKNTPLVDFTLPMYQALPMLLQTAPVTVDGKLYLPSWDDILRFDEVIRGAIIKAAGAGQKVKQVNLDSVFSRNGTPIGIAPSDGSAEFRDLRFADPSAMFSRYGLVPLVTNYDGQAEGNPQGGNPPSPLFISQMGWYVNTGMQEGGVAEYLDGIVQSISDAHEAFLTALQDAIDSWNDEVAQWQEDKANADPDSEPPPPPEFDPNTIPQSTQITIPYPGDALGINNIPSEEDLSYEYQLQIPDEEFGVLRGNDYYVVIRAADTAEVGDRFQVRMGPGAISYVSYTDTNAVFSNKFGGESTGSIVTSPIVVRSANVPPTFKFISPGAGQNTATEDLTFEISWLAEDPDNDATINLYVDTDNKGFDGKLLVAGLTEGVDTRYTINLAEDIPEFDPGLAYYVYASITDGINDPELAYADGPIVAQAAGEAKPGEIPVNPRGDLIDYYKLISDGRIFNLGEAPSLGEVTALGGTSMAIDMELAPDYSGAVVLATDGRVFAVGNVGLFSEQVASDGEIVFANNPIEDASSGLVINQARDVEVDFERGTVYILDMDGDFVSLGSEPARDLAPPVVFPGVDLYRDMELTPDGEGMYFLTFNGNVYASGTAGDVGDGLGFTQDLARDMELVSSGGGTAGIIVMDAFGKLYGLGGATLPPHQPTPSTEPVYRNLAKIVGQENAYLLAEGGGRIEAATSEDILLPTDLALFGDAPGMQDDHVVDVETAAFNLRDIPHIINNLFYAFSHEDISAIMALTADSYLDAQGMDRTALASALSHFFDYYQMNIMGVGSAQDAMHVSFQGNKVIIDANVQTTYFLPRVTRLSPEAQEGQIVFSDPYSFPGEQGAAGLPFSQTITMEEMGDGRGWELYVYDIDDTLNKRLNEFAPDEFKGADGYSKLKQFISASGNRSLAYAAFQSDGPEKRKRIHFKYHGPSRLNSLLFLFRQTFLSMYYSPPVMQMLWYFGDMASWSSDAFEIQMENINGQFKITSLRMPQRMRVNSNGSAISADAETPPPPLEPTLEVEIPDGFSFTDGSMVPTLQPGDADVILESEGRLAVTMRQQGIMNLGTNIDIFSLNLQDVMKMVSRFSMLTDSLDPQPDTAYSTNVTPGGSYFVILRDGKHFALMTVLPTGAEQQGEAATEIFFEWVARDDFVLPPNF